MNVPECVPGPLAGQQLRVTDSRRSPVVKAYRNIPDKAADADATAYKQLLTDIEMLDPT